MTNDGQKRAKIGGEFGPNGEWYKGGAFIATTDAPKSAKPEPRPEDPEAAERRAAAAAQAARIAEWLEGRRTSLNGIIATLTANPGIDEAIWQQKVVDHAAGFLPSLGRTLWVQGNLSARQAEAVAKAILGRQTKKNAEEWDRMIENLTAQFA